MDKNIQAHLYKLNKDLLNIKYVTDVKYDLSGYTDNINAPIILVDYDIPFDIEVGQWFKEKNKLKGQVIDIIENNGVKVEREEFEDNDTYFYIVSYHTNWDENKLEEDLSEDNSVSNEESNEEISGNEKDGENSKDLHEKWINYLKSKIDEYCNLDNRYEVYWDYRDELEPATIERVVDTAIKNDTSIESELEDWLWDINDVGEIESTFTDEVRKNIPEDLVEYSDDRDLYDDLYEAGYEGIDFQAKELLDRATVRVNVVFATPDESNYDMGSIVDVFGSWKDPAYDYIVENPEILNNSMVYLVHQQGHSMKEYYQCLLANPGGFKMEHKNTFIESVVDDCVNNSSEAMSGFTCLTKLTPYELYELKKAAKEGKGSLEFSKDTCCGTVNIWAGSGGLSVELEKPFIVPASYAHFIQVEGGDNSIGYTVDEIFGLTSDCWDGDMKIVNTQPTLYQESTDDIIKYIETLIDKGEDK